MLLHEKLKAYHLILASASPRRRQLLADCGLVFDVAAKFDCDESFPADMPVHEVAEYISQQKSRSYPQTLSENDILLTADTVVIVDDVILGKPADEQDAERMLRMLAGRSHKVITGVTIRMANSSHSFSVESGVKFRDLSDDEISYYISEYRPFDKAGAYGIQEWIGYVAIEGIDGSFFNVMGLPVQKLYVELNKLL
jgi:septum formation protein